MLAASYVRSLGRIPQRCAEIRAGMPQPHVDRASMASMQVLLPKTACQGMFLELHRALSLEVFILPVPADGDHLASPIYYISLETSEPSAGYSLDGLIAAKGDLARFSRPSSPCEHGDHSPPFRRGCQCNPLC
jgi:hypothetical protein